MITLTGIVYHEEKPIALCPLYHPCVDDWDEKANINKPGWISLSPYSSYFSLPPPPASCQSLSTSSLTSSSNDQTSNSTIQTAATSSSASSAPSIVPKSASSSSPSLPTSTHSFTPPSTVGKKSSTFSPSSSSLTIYSPSNGSGIHFRFEVERWSLVKYNLTFYQLTYVFKEIWQSKNFRRSIVRSELIPKECRQSIRTLIFRGANIDLFVRFKINDCHTTPIDWSGNYLFLALVSLKLKIEETLSILSTLGGAYSSLGEHYRHFAIKAGETSIKQIGLASITADPTVIARCSIYMVYSLCQRDLRKRARRLMINFIYPYITKMISKKTCDNIVRNMYKAAKFRIEHYYNEI